MVLREEEGLEKSLHTLTLGRGVKPILTYSFPSGYFILKIARSIGLAGIIFHLRLEGIKRIVRMSCFSVTDPFLTTLYYVKKLNGILCKNRGRGLKNLMYPYMEVGGGQKLSKSSLHN